MNSFGMFKTQLWQGEAKLTFTEGSSFVNNVHTKLFILMVNLRERGNHVIFSILRRKRSLKAITLVSQFGKCKETKISNYRAYLLLFCQIVRLVMEIWVMMLEARQPGSKSEYGTNCLKGGLPFKGQGSLNAAWELQWPRGNSTPLVQLFSWMFTISAFLKKQLSPPSIILLFLSFQLCWFLFFWFLDFFSFSTFF